eukprot:10032974-Karenia_brevis.AAC.1
MKSYTNLWNPHSHASMWAVAPGLQGTWWRDAILALPDGIHGPCIALLSPLLKPPNRPGIPEVVVSGCF